MCRDIASNDKSAFPPELVDNPDDSKHNQEAGGSNRTTDGIVLNIMIKRASIHRMTTSPGNLYSKAPRPPQDP